MSVDSYETVVPLGSLLYVDIVSKLLKPADMMTKDSVLVASVKVVWA